MHLFLVRTMYEVHVYQVCDYTSMDWLAISDGWALVSDGWENAHPGLPLVTPVLPCLFFGPYSNLKFIILLTLVCLLFLT